MLYSYHCSVGGGAIPGAAAGGIDCCSSAFIVQKSYIYGGFDTKVGGFDGVSLANSVSYQQ